MDGQAVQLLLSELAKVAAGQEVQTPRVVALVESQVRQLVPVQAVQAPALVVLTGVAFREPYPTAQELQDGSVVRVD
jgi:hypothetical protein